MDYPKVTVEPLACDECRIRFHFQVGGYREQRIVLPMFEEVRQNLPYGQLRANRTIVVAPPPDHHPDHPPLPALAPVSRSSSKATCRYLRIKTPVQVQEEEQEDDKDEEIRYSPFSRQVGFAALP